MPIYSLAVTTTGTASGAAAWEIRAGTKNFKLLELGFFLNAATASIIGLGLPAAIGVTPTSPVTFLNEGGVNDRAATAQSALAWGTGPTVPANFNRKISLPANAGAGIIWQFPRGYEVAGNSSVVLCNSQLNSALSAYAIIEE